MAGRKKDITRAFTPDYVSAETLAYRLDCSRSTIDDYVRRGLLPQPQMVGNLQRWRWSDIESWIAVRTGLPTLDGSPVVEEDPYMKGVNRVTAPEA